MNEVTAAVHAAMTTGDRAASQYLLRLLSHSLDDGFRSCLLCATIFEMTSRAGWHTRDAVVVHFLAATLSSFFRRRVPVLLRSRHEQERRLMVIALQTQFVPPMVQLLICVGAAEGRVARRLRRSLSDCVAMCMLFVTHDVVGWVQTHAQTHVPQEYQRAQVVLDVVLAAMGVVADVTVSIGPVTRSANRLAIQKQLDALLVLPYGSQGIESSEAAPAVLQAAEFLSNYSTLLPQEQCPRFYDLLPSSGLWKAVLNGLQSGEEASIAAAAAVINSISVVDGTETVAIVLEALQAVHRSASQPSISRVMHAVLEGPLGDILLVPEAADVRQMVEQYFANLATAIQESTLDASSRHQWCGVLQEGVVLLLGSLRPQDVPMMEEDDDKDDFATVVEEIETSNNRKQQCVGRLQGFLEWTCDFLSQSVLACDEQAYTQLLESWMDKDEEQWQYDVDFPAGVVLSAVCLERLLCLAPTCALRLPDSIVSYGAMASSRLYESIVATGRPSVHQGDWEVCGAGVAWYVALLVRRGALQPDAITALLGGVLTVAGAPAKAAIALLRACSRLPSVVVPVALVEQVWQRAASSYDAANVRALMSAVDALQKQRQILGSLCSLTLLWDGTALAAYPVDIQLGALGSAWASEDVFPHTVALLALSTLMGALNATATPSSMQHQHHIPEVTWSVLAGNMRRYQPETPAEMGNMGQALLAVIARASAMYASECVAVAQSFCASPRVRGSAVHAAVGEAWRTIATGLTCQRPIPFVDLSSIVGAAIVFECGLIDWYLSLVVWSLREQQARTLYTAAAVGLVSAAARGCCVLLNNDALPQPQCMVSWLNAADALVSYLVCVLGTDVVDDVVAADAGADAVQQCGEMVWLVACRVADAGVPHTHMGALDPVTVDALQHTTDAFEASSRLRVLMTQDGTRASSASWFEA